MFQVEVPVSSGVSSHLKPPPPHHAVSAAAKNYRRGDGLGDAQKRGEPRKRRGKEKN